MGAENFQESYAAVIRAIQSELIFIQRNTWDMGGEFSGVENMIQETFLPRLFLRKKNPLAHCRRSKYNVGQDIRILTPEFSDVREI